VSADMDEKRAEAIIDSVRVELRAMETRFESRFESIQLAFESHRESSISREQRLTNEINSNREAVRQVREIADRARAIADSTHHEANVVFEAIKGHNALLEKRIQSFEHTLAGVADENRVQTSTLAELASEAEERSRRSAETQTLVRALQVQSEQLLTAERDRATREAIDKALRDEREKRQDVIWKRLPVYISLAIVLAGLFSWVVSAMVRDKPAAPQTVYLPATAPSTSAASNK